MEKIRNLGNRLGLFFCSYCEKEVVKQLGNGNQQVSCGCAKHILLSNALTKHGGKGTKLYAVWTNMRGRCLYKSNGAYEYYGGRGISICDKWTDFLAFKAWAEKSGYKKGLTIDRIDNDGNYLPENCRWVTLQENVQNSRKIKLSEENKMLVRYLHWVYEYSHRQLAKVFVVSKSHIGDIINYKKWVNIKWREV